MPAFTGSTWFCTAVERIEQQMLSEGLTAVPKVLALSSDISLSPLKDCCPISNHCCANVLDIVNLPVAGKVGPKVQ
jgi:hypothetical protein